MDNPLTTWFYTTGKFVTDSEKQEVTHFLLDGGKLDISKDYELFQEICKIRVASGSRFEGERAIWICSRGAAAAHA